MTEIPHPVTDAIVGVVVSASAWISSRSGTKRGMNGTAAAVHRIEQKLDGHIVHTGGEFTSVREDVSNTRERLANMEGALERLAPPKPTRRPR